MIFFCRLLRQASSLDLTLETFVFFVLSLGFGRLLSLPRRGAHLPHFSPLGRLYRYRGYYRRTHIGEKRAICAPRSALYTHALSALLCPRVLPSRLCRAA